MTGYNTALKKLTKPTKGGMITKNQELVTALETFCGFMCLLLKQGRTKKFLSLCKGSCTVIDKTSDTNYKIQLVGANKTSIVHENRMKLCYGKPHWKAHPKADKLTTLKDKSEIPMTHAKADKVMQK